MPRSYSKDRPEAALGRVGHTPLSRGIPIFAASGSSLAAYGAALAATAGMRRRHDV